MEYIYDFGKIDASGTGRRINNVEVRVRLEEVGRGTVAIGDNRTTALQFTASAAVYNKSHTEAIIGGQCLDRLLKYPELANNHAFREIHDMWKKYHLNTLNAGTPRQTAALEQAVAEGKLENRNADNYQKCCDYLESIGLLYDDGFLVNDGKHAEAIGYKYGCGWITYDIPPDDLEKCKDIASGKLDIKISKAKAEMER